MSGQGSKAWEARTPELIALLTDSCLQLRSLEHWTPWSTEFCIPKALSASLGHLSQLTSLELGLGWAATTVEVVGMLQGLPSLLHLGLVCHPLGAVKITNTILRGHALERLTIWDPNMRDLALVPGELSSLTRLALHAQHLRSLPGTISLLTGLREIDLADNDWCSLPAGLAACTNLTSLAMGYGSGMSVLTKLDSLRSLSFRHVIITYSAQEKWTPLVGLTQFSMRVRFGAECPDITGMPCLRKLILSNCRVYDLPSGTYLSRLTSLRMFDCIFESGVPAALTNASQLRVLHLLGSNQEIGIKLSDSDLKILTSLPALEILVLKKPYERGEEGWDDRVALLMRQYTALGYAQPKLLSDPEFETRPADW